MKLEKARTTIHEKKTEWRKLAHSKTENLEALIDKVTFDSKSKEALMKPVTVTRDNIVSKASMHFFSSIVYDMSNERDK